MRQRDLMLRRRLLEKFWNISWLDLECPILGNVWSALRPKHPVSRGPRPPSDQNDLASALKGCRGAGASVVRTCPGLDGCPARDLRMRSRSVPLSPGAWC